MTTKLKVEYKSKILTGILIKQDENYLTLKLDNGYNININQKEVKILETKKIELTNNNNNSKNNKNMLKKNSLPKITLIHTGGTIASKVDYKTGAVSSKFTPQELMGLFSELTNIANIDAKMIGNMASDDMRFEHYNIMIEEITNAINEGSIGIIITHGTDTLHYTSAALSYALNNLPIPVILVGAQRSSDRASSDAFSNLQAATKFIIENSKQNSQFKRVGICMHENSDDLNYLILDGINAKKMHSTRRDAFKQINYLPFARVNNHNIEVLRNDFIMDNFSKFNFTKFDTNLKIGFLKIHPHMFADEIKSYKKFDAIIIEGTGLGHIPISKVDFNTKEHLKILEEVKNLINIGVKVIIGVQTVYGQTNLNVYSPGRKLVEIGVLGNYMNLTTETLFIRTAYILSKDKNNFEKIWNENLEGFNTNRSIYIENEN